MQNIKVMLHKINKFYIEKQKQHVGSEWQHAGQLRNNYDAVYIITKIYVVRVQYGYKHSKP